MIMQHVGYIGGALPGLSTLPGGGRGGWCSQTSCLAIACRNEGWGGVGMEAHFVCRPPPPMPPAASFFLSSWLLLLWLAHLETAMTSQHTPPLAEAWTEQCRVGGVGWGGVGWGGVGRGVVARILRFGCHPGSVSQREADDLMVDSPEISGEYSV